MITHLAAAAASCTTGTWAQQWKCGWNQPVSPRGAQCRLQLRPQPASRAGRPCRRHPPRQVREEAEEGPRAAPGRRGGPAMTEAAQRKAVARPASRLPVSRPVLWTGIALGAFLAAEALLHRLVLPLGLPGFVSAAITAVLIVALAVVARRADPAAPPHRRPGTRSGTVSAARSRPPGTPAGTAGPSRLAGVARPLPAGRTGSTGP